jgi:hypothetical protein
VDEGTVKHVESGPPTPQARTPTTPGCNNSGIGRSVSAASSVGAESVRRLGNGVRRNVSTSSKRSRQSGLPSPVTPSIGTPTTSGVHRSNTLPSKRSPALNNPRFPRDMSGPSTPSAEEPKSPLSSPIAAEAAAIVASLGPVSRQTVVVPPAVKESESVKPAEPVKPAELAKPTETVKPAEEAPEEFIPQGRPPATTPAINSIPGAFPLPSPGIIPPSQDVTPSVTAQPASELIPPPAPMSVTGHRSPRLTPTKERSEFLEAPIDSSPTAEITPATRTFTQILAKAAASPVSEGKDGRKPNKLQKKRIPSSAISSAHSSTHSLTGGDMGVGMTPIDFGQQAPLHPPQPPFAQGYSQGSSSKEALHSNSTDTNSSRNSGQTLKPSMSPSTSFRSHSTATEYSEAAEPTEEAREEAREEKRKFWKAHKRGDSRATPTASQTDLHGSVPGGDKSMSSFGSSSGWGGGSRRSLQYDSHQNLDQSTAYGSPPDNEKPEKKGSAFDWFHKMRSDHKDRSDKRERAKSPPGSSSFLPPPQNLRAPAQEVSNGRGRSMDVSRSTPEGSNDVTPTGSTSQPPLPIAQNTKTAATAGTVAFSRHDARQAVPTAPNVNPATSAATAAASRQNVPVASIKNPATSAAAAAAPRQNVHTAPTTNHATSAATAAASRQDVVHAAPPMNPATFAATAAASRQSVPIVPNTSAAITAAATTAASRYEAQRSVASQSTQPTASAFAPQMQATAPTSQQPTTNDVPPQPAVSHPTAQSVQSAPIASESQSQPVPPVPFTPVPGSGASPSANAS